MKKLALIAAMGALCVACSSAPPKPPAPEGDLVPANDQRALEEIVRAAVAATNPQQQRFAATRGETLKDVLIRWARQERIQLAYLTDFNPTLHGAINEPDLRAAGIALSVLLQHEGTGALLDFNVPGALTVKDTR
jgi:hypothetical protein